VSEGHQTEFEDAF